MKFADLYQEAILWTCYLENFPEPERFLSIYGLGVKDVSLFDCLGRFFPFDEFYVRIDCPDAWAINDLNKSKKSLILPWIYRPKEFVDTLSGQRLICPSAEMFALLDNKLKAKEILKSLEIPTPDWGFVNRGIQMVEKPIQNSAGGLGISLTNSNPRDGYYLEDYLIGYRSIGLQFFVYNEVEFLCANEMLYHEQGQGNFTFHSQINVCENELSPALMGDCFDLIRHLQGRGYRGLINIDALVGDNGHCLLEVNPRGSAFLPAFFAASAHGWIRFITHVKEETAEKGEILLLSFGRLKKVVRKLP
ncbi:MAG: ATP-grasp domain-containing protein [Nitrospirota bacterium]